jgi:hypothetical protein
VAEIFRNAPGILTTISVYVAAHADDWQLFMQPQVYLDLTDHHCKTIIIITTAGDAGQGEPFWRAREEGSKSSVRFCLAPQGPIAESGGARQINSHMVEYWSANNTTTYFLRLPDGNLDGRGFAANGFQSLPKFKSGEISELSAVDHSVTFSDWPSFVDAIERIICIESGGIRTRRIHYLSPDPLVNPGDHPDHVATGVAIQDMSDINTFQQLLFPGYCSKSAPGEQLQKDLAWKAGIFAAYEKAVYDCCGYSTLKENPDLYANWCCRKANVEVIFPFNK